AGSDALVRVPREREGGPGFLRERLDARRIVVLRNADDDDVSVVFLREVLIVGERNFAGLAPGRPEIDQDDLAGSLPERRARATGLRRQVEVRRLRTEERMFPFVTGRLGAASPFVACGDRQRAGDEEQRAERRATDMSASKIEHGRNKQ